MSNPTRGIRWFLEGGTPDAPSAYANEAGLRNVDTSGKVTPYGYWGYNATVYRLEQPGPPAIRLGTNYVVSANFTEGCYGVRLKDCPYSSGIGLDSCRPDGTFPEAGSYTNPMTLYAPGDLE